MKIIIITFITMLCQLWIVLRYECWRIEHVLFHRRRNKSYCTCCNLVPQGIKDLNINIISIKFALNHQLLKSKLKMEYYIRRKINPFAINTFHSIKNSSVIQYIYWKIRIKAIRLRLIEGNGGHAMSTRKY